LLSSLARSRNNIQRRTWGHFIVVLVYAYFSIIWGRNKASGYDSLKIRSASYLGEFWSEMFSNRDVNSLEIELNAQSFRQQQDRPTRRARG
jgi:hypothetical protein